ncbi:alternate signal-mediated exported protein [Pseudarthrobacter defluvii]|uniref:Alternate signal-mediated exported protein n=1 Tax=Pseudarthrobacter defluvii TaxID=410837 RepID=A0ABT9UN37_9MICC|nr:alternate-type signal peptide domain-containing protein [Pseudarthrobacter defluvii]MDQ0120368.1 alternate signal-mediated exported protein [Pseudarthrobacter defluvii]
MKNSTLIKGTAAIAVGAALLLGGGGTLAAWNAADAAAPGTISSGDLNVKASTGKWIDRAGNVINNIGAYRVVPGDKLTYTQDLTVTLIGDKMAANIVVSGANAANNFTPANVIITGPALKVGGAVVANPLTATSGTSTRTVTATTTFEFKATTSDRNDVNTSYNLGDVSYTLTQVVSAPGLADPTPQP